jgi:hypothetical protein
MKYSGRISRRESAPALREPCATEESTRITFFRSSRLFLLGGMETYPIGPDERENKTHIAPNTP